MKTQAQIETECQVIYQEASDFFAGIYRPTNYGFKILNAPPRRRPPVLFIGYQPGGRAGDFERETANGTDRSWPQTAEYANAGWLLAKRMQKVFQLGLLEQCVGTNAIFLRYPNAKTYRLELDVNKRSKIEAFCTARVYRIVEILQPDQIVTIGFKTLKLFGVGEPDLMNEQGRTLIQVGEIAGHRATAMLHLSGSRISNVDLNKIKQYFDQRLH